MQSRLRRAAGLVTALLLTTTSAVAADDAHRATIVVDAFGELAAMQDRRSTD